MGQVINGYIYHTKYDRVEVIPRGAIQNTGDNVLGLVRSLSNATELYNMEVKRLIYYYKLLKYLKYIFIYFSQAYEGGHAVFFDYLGLFLVTYSKETGTIINYSVAGSVIALILISVYRMSVLSSLSFCSVTLRLISLTIIQIIALVLSVAFPLFMAYYFDSIGLSMVYFSSPWLIIGLYICPSLIGLSLPILIYLQCQQQVRKSFFK